MAKLSREEIIEKLESLEVEYDPKVTTKELLALLKESEEEAGEEVEKDESNDESTDDKEEVNEEGSSDTETIDSPTSITFKIRNPNVREKSSERTFSKSIHGKDFMELAKIFETANTHKKPVDLLNKEEVDNCVAFNRDIKHPIISNHVE